MSMPSLHGNCQDDTKIPACKELLHPTTTIDIFAGQISSCLHIRKDGAMRVRPRIITGVMILLFVGCGIADALPRFSIRTGAKCQSCHVNPSGGGMRQAFGVQYGRETLPVPTWSDEFGLDDFSTKLSDWVSIGADFRTLYFYQQNPDTGTPPSSVTASNAFWQMQGNVYMHFKLAQKVSIYLGKGLYSGFEIFGLLNVLPLNGSVKVGKFVPNYGLKLDDHRAYVRTYTGFSPELGRPELTGAEVSIVPGPLMVTGGIFNSNDGFGAGTPNGKAFLGRAEGLFKLTEELHLGLGGNVFTKKNPSGSRRTLLGGFGSVSYRDLTLLAEADVVEDKLGSDKTTALATFAEIDYVLVPGLDLKLGYDFCDPDTKLKTGATSKYTVGLEFFPIPGVEVRPLYHFVKDDPVDIKNDEFQLMLHFYL